MVPPRPPSESGEGPIVAVVGSRNYKTLSDVDRWIGSLARKHPGSVIVSGAARGVDRQAARSARARGLDVVSFRPYEFTNMEHRPEFSIETETTGQRAHEIVTAANRRLNPPTFTTYAACAKHRNGWIVATCDHLVAFWDGRSGGTFDAIHRARKAGKLSVVTSNEAAVIAELMLTLDAKPLR